MPRWALCLGLSLALFGLRWPEYSQPHLGLYRNPQTLWCVPAKSAMHQWSIPVSCHPHG